MTSTKVKFTDSVHLILTVKAVGACCTCNGTGVDRLRAENDLLTAERDDLRARIAEIERVIQVQADACFDAGMPEAHEMFVGVLARIRGSR